MEADFVNIFVEKQRESIIDLTSRNIMLEARITYAEQKNKVVQEYEQTIVNLQNKNEELIRNLAQFDGLQESCTAKDKELFHLKTKMGEMEVDIDQLRKTVKQMTMENEVQVAKALRLKNKAKQLAEE
jgi:predicted RNase H-like nuclease (RuvC/YqgF family)